MRESKIRLSDKRYLYKNYIKDNDNKSFSYEFFTNSMINENINLEQYGSPDIKKKYKNNSQMPPKLNGKNNFILHDFRQTFNEDDNKSTIVPYKMCDNNITCIQLCCRLGDRLIDEKCVAENGKYLFPNVYEFITNNTLVQNEDKGSNKTLFKLIVHDPCQKTGHFVLNSDNYPDDEYIFLANGSLYQPHHDKFIQSTSYCLAIVHREEFDVIICINTKNEIKESISAIMNETINEMINKNINEWLIKQPIIIIFDILSLLFPLMTFVVYSVLPELQNIHSYILRRYVGSMFVGGTCYFVIQYIQLQDIGNYACFTLGTI